MNHTIYSTTLLRRRGLLHLLMTVIIMMVFQHGYGQEGGKPNIVLIFVDDWAWSGTPIHMDDEMINSAMPLLQMPNLEQLAKRGMKFQNAYSGAPQCSPSRASLQTGQSSPRNGYTVYMNSRGSDYYDPNSSYSQFPVIACVSDMYLDEDEYTVAKALNPLGYVCAHFGKWHMRGDPGDYGYAFHNGETTNNEGNEQIPGDPKRMFSLTEESIGFMRDQAAAGQPFYLQISHWAMHAGSECLPETRAKYQNMPEIQAYYDSRGTTASTINYKADPATWLGMGEDLDVCIGRVLQSIRDLGIEDNTYVVLTSDNGYRHSELVDINTDLTQPLHGHKWWLWQGGVRVPMLAAGPGIPSNSISETYVVNYDFLPTFVDWAGGDPGALAEVDGKSLAGILRGEKPASDLENRNLHFHYPHYRTSMPMTTMISAGKWKIVHFFEAPDVPMLFDLAIDPGEVKNVARMQPVKHDMLFREMMKYLDEVGARIPLYPNPDYDPAVYQEAKEYDTRVKWGPFEGERPLEADEK